MILIAGLAGSALAQNSRDTLALKPKAAKTSHTPSKATILAAVIPGAGQFYNRKYWKVPIAYTGYAVAGYMFKANQKLYRDAKKNYLAATDTLSSTVNQSGRSSSALLSDIDNYRRYRDLSVLALLAWHGLTIIDANVDAHFFYWDVGEDLSLKIRPRPMWVGRMNPGFGLCFTLNDK